MLLATKNLSKAYQLRKEIIPVLQDITLEINQGDFIAVMGESGSGKTTFLNCISTLDRPSSGEIIFNQQNIVSLKPTEIENLRLKQFGFIFQDNHLISSLTLLENIAIARLQYDQAAYQKAEQLCLDLGILALKNNYPHQVSGGEKQRAAIARALINQPAIIFADEPTASLNPQTAQEIMAILNDINATGQTIVMVTHSKKIALHASRLLVLDNGNFIIDVSLKNQTDKETFISQQVDAYL